MTGPGAGAVGGPLARWLRRLPTDPRDAGTALVEFFYLAVLLMVPLAYVVASAARVQSAAFGVTTAAREAGRAYATAPAGSDRQQRAQLAAQLALADQGLREVPVLVERTAGGGAGSVEVRVAYDVELPGVPLVLGGGLVSIPVRASHLQRLDPYVAGAAR